MGNCCSSSDSTASPAIVKHQTASESKAQKLAQFSYGFQPDRASEDRITQLILGRLRDGREASLNCLEDTVGKSSAFSSKRADLLSMKNASDKDFAREAARVFVEGELKPRAALAQRIVILPQEGVSHAVNVDAVVTSMPSAQMIVHPQPSWMAEFHYIRRENRLIPPFAPEQQMCVFAAGCFWGTEKGFWRLPGVYSTAVGYIGGKKLMPTYKEVCSGRTGHTEGTLVVWDPKEVSLADLLQRFFDCHDPTQGDGQGNDIGSQCAHAVDRLISMPLSHRHDTSTTNTEQSLFCTRPLVQTVPASTVLPKSTQ